MSSLRNICGVIAMAIGTTCHLFAGVGVLKGDTYVSGSNPGGNFGSSTLINVGSGNSGLVQYDLTPLTSQLLSSIPSTVTPIIGKATLTVYVNKALVSGTLTAAPFLSAWMESTVTQSTLPAVGPVAGSAAVAASGQFVTIDITPIVQGWLSSNNNSSSPDYVGGGNFGISLASPDGGVFVLDSKEATTTSHAASLNVELATDFTGVLHKSMPLTAFGFTPLMSIALTGTNTAGGRIFYTVRATDGGTQVATEEGVIQFLASANTVTCTVQPTDKIHLGTVGSACSPSFFNPGSQPGVYIYDNVSFGTSAPIAVHEVFYRIENLSGAVIRLEP